MGKKIENIILQIGVFLLNYISFVAFFILSLPVIFILFSILNINKHWTNTYEIWGLVIPEISAFTLIIFIFLISLGIVRIRKIKNGAHVFNKLYMPILLFFSPTLNSCYIISTSYVGNKIISFGGIFPFGYSFVNFIRNIRKQVRFIEYSWIETYQEFNMDSFDRIFQEKWLFVHFLSILFAILFVFLYGKILKKIISSKQ